MCVCFETVHVLKQSASETVSQVTVCVGMLLFVIQSSNNTPANRPDPLTKATMGRKDATRAHNDASESESESTVTMDADSQAKGAAATPTPSE